MIGIKMRRSWKLAAAVVVIAAVCAACKGGGEAGGGNQMVEAGDEAAGRDKDGEMAGGDLDGAGAGEENSRREDCGIRERRTGWREDWRIRGRRRKFHGRERG